jgi:hypothetical protein
MNIKNFHVILIKEAKKGQTCEMKGENDFQVFASLIKNSLIVLSRANYAA